MKNRAKIAVNVSPSGGRYPQIQLRPDDKRHIYMNFGSIVSILSYNILKNFFLAEYSKFQFEPAKCICIYIYVCMFGSILFITSYNFEYTKSKN